MQSDVKYDFVFVDEEGFNRYSPKSFDELVTHFRQYKGGLKHETLLPKLTYGKRDMPTIEVLFEELAI